MSFRTLDDIKETVRKAAFITCKTLTNLTIRYCDPDFSSPEEGKKMMSYVIPYMLDKGILSDAEDVRRFSMSTVITLCKKAGVFLQPHISDIVGTLLECMSSLEPQVMNYLSFHADKYEISQEQMDNSRVTAAKMSPIMEACENCIDYVDEQNLSALCPKLTHLIRRGIGLPTKVSN